MTRTNDAPNPDAGAIADPRGPAPIGGHTFPAREAAKGSMFGQEIGRAHV